MVESLTPAENRKKAFATLASGLLVTDKTFDRIYPDRIRKQSSMFWTPVAVGRRVARLFEAQGAKRVLDVGAGVGKFCIVSALTTKLEMTGLEHRLNLVETTEQIVREFSIPRVTLQYGGLGDVDLHAYDGIYLYNPFEEAAIEPSAWIDRTLPLSPEQTAKDIAIMEAFLASARRGTTVITYHGFGGVMPPGWTLRAEQTRGVEFLRCWVAG